MSIIRIMMGGMVGAVLGAAIWVILDSMVPISMGFLALAVGWLVGSGIRRVRCAADATWLLAAASSLCTLMAVFVTLYANAHVEVRQLRRKLVGQPPQRELLVSCYAERLAEQLHAAGQPVELAHDAPLASPSRYPTALWNVAAEQWDEFLDDERSEYVRQAQRHRAAAAGCGPQVLAGPVGEAVAKRFRHAWSIPQLLWLTLAMTVSIPLASAGRDEDQTLENDDDDDLTGELDEA